MAAIGETNPTLADHAKRRDPDGSIAMIAELLEESNEILEDMPFMEGNLPTGHVTTVRTGLPTPTWRLLNGGVTPDKSETAQVTEAIGSLEAYSEVDKDLAELSGDLNAFRFSEAKAFIEAMGQEFAETVFYGASTDEEEFVGLAERYNSLSASNGDNVIDGGGTGSDNLSIWLIGWGDRSCSGIFPKGSKAGLIHEDLGLETVTVTQGVGGSLMRAYREHFQMKGGICLKDWRHVVRIANIDVSALAAETGDANITDLMVKAIHRLPNMGNGANYKFYMNRTAIQYLDIQRGKRVTDGGGVTYENVDGKVIMSFRGYPIRRVDQLTDAESAVS